MSKTSTRKTFHEIVNGNKPTLVDFHATWCGPCKMMVPILKELAADMKDNINILKVDIDKNEALAQKLRIQGVPTIVIYKKGEIVWRQSGVQRLHQLKLAIEEYID